MLEGPTEEIRLHCTPAEAVAITVNGERTPFDGSSLELDKRRDTHFVTVEKVGYRPSTLSFDRELDPVWAIADLIWGPAAPLAWFVDWQTGALYRLDPRDVHVVLRREGSSER